MSDNWIEIRAEGPRGRKEEASFFLIRAGSPGVLEEHKGTRVGKLISHSTWDEETLEEDDTSPTAVYKAYLPPDKPEKIEEIRVALNGIGWSLTSSIFKDKDWSKKWMTGIKTVKVSYKGTSVIVKPTWKKAAKVKGDIVIDIDPGMAFGTGGHATTKMCLKAILTLLLSKKGIKDSLLDVGTGTGVLAIAARKLKVKKAVGIDIDPVALKVAKKNAKMNRSDITISKKPVEEVKGLYSIVAANILAGELKRLSAPIIKRVRPGGFLILSGILKTEEESVRSAYLASGLKSVRTYSIGEWVALVFSKP